MAPSIDDLMEGRPLKVGDNFVLNKVGAEEVNRYKTLGDLFKRRAKEGDTVKVSGIMSERGGTITVHIPFAKRWTAINRREHNWFSAKAPEQESPSASRERR